MSFLLLKMIEKEKQVPFYMDSVTTNLIMHSSKPKITPYICNFTTVFLIQDSIHTALFLQHKKKKRK